MIPRLLNLKKDFIIFTIFLIIADIVQSQLLKIELFSGTWINLAIGTYIGLFVYHVLLYKVTNYIIKKFHKKAYYDSYEDIIKYLSVFICQYITMITLSNLNIEWLISACLTLISFIIFALVEPTIIPRLYNSNDQILLNNLVKIGGAVLLYSYFITGPINENPLIAIFPLYLAFCAFHLCSNIIS